MKLIHDRVSDKLIVVRSDQYKERYNNIIKYQHNLLRITRILKCLNIMNKTEEVNAFLNHLIYEVYASKELDIARSSCKCYWVKLSKVFQNEDIEHMVKEKIIRIINDKYHK